MWSRRPRRFCGSRRRSVRARWRRRSSGTCVRSAIALAELRDALESYAQAGLELELAEARLEEHLIRAPFDGVAIRVHAEEGSILAPGAPVLELVSASHLCVDLHLPAQSASRLRVGDRYALRVHDPEEAVVVGRVRYVERRIDSVARTMRVVFDVEPGEAVVLPGAIVTPVGR